MTQTMTDDIPHMTLLTDEPASSPLFPWRHYQFPISWAAQFNKPAEALPLHLEVGFGDGRYTARRAQDKPDECFVGLEISGSSIQRALRRMQREELDNVRLLKVGAQFAVRHLFEPRSLRSITVNFPDPWPKERHQDNRLLRLPFFELAASRLQVGGDIMLATDHPDYLAFSQAEGRRSGLFELLDTEPPAAVFETKYALKWKEQGKPLYYQVFRYAGQKAPSFDILEREEIMPHALLSGELPHEVAFTKQVLPYAGGHVILHEAMKSFGGDNEAGHGNRWLVRATIDEADLRQQILVVVQRRGGSEGMGEWIVRLEPFGDPIITKVTRGAVHTVTEWLLDLPADLKVSRRAY